MTLFTVLFLFLILAVNTLLWWVYRRGLVKQVQTQQERINNAYIYVDELQRRCQRYQGLLENKTAIRVAPVPRGDTTWVIEYHLN